MRKGIRPQTSPAEMKWEKTKIIVSKSSEHQTKSPEKAAKSGKISFPGLKKNKKKTDSHEFTNQSYQQQLELSKFMDTLEEPSPTASSVENERIVVGSESLADSSFTEQSRGGTLSGLQITNAVPVQKFSGETEMMLSKHNESAADSPTSAELQGKGKKKKKLVFNKMKKKFKKDKSGASVAVDGPLSSPHDNSTAKHQGNTQKILRNIC